MAQKTFKLDEGTCLDRYIQTEIQAPFAFVTSAQELINAVARILHSSAFPYSVAEVVKVSKNVLFALFFLLLKTVMG